MGSCHASESTYCCSSGEDYSGNGTRLVRVGYRSTVKPGVDMEAIIAKAKEFNRTIKGSLHPYTWQLVIQLKFFRSGWSPVVRPENAQVPPNSRRRGTPGTGFGSFSLGIRQLAVLVFISAQLSI